VSTALLAVAVAAGLACPAHMAWQMRRGRRAPCCPAPRREDDAAELHRRQQALRANLDALADNPSSASDADAGYAVRQ
jgi:hypothetical protein